MPPKLKKLPPKPTLPQPPDQHGNGVLTVGNLQVGPAGVVFTGEGEFHVPRPDINIENLHKVRQLGQGTQGNVSMYRMVDGSVFAVKKMPIPSTADNRMRQTVAAELRNIFTDKGNKFTVALYNAFFRDGVLRLVLEYMDWGNLEELLDQKKKIPEEACAYIASQMLHALEILHTKANIVTETNQTKTLRQIHRDIKPANVLLSVNGDVKVADFGIATSAETIGVNSFVGTATYMSPERIQGRQYSTPSDIWSVGVVVAQILLGRYPFNSIQKGFMGLLKEITALNSYPIRELSGCSEDAQQFLDRCLCQDPQKRATATELLQSSWVVNNQEKGKEALIELLVSLGDATTRCTEVSNKGAGDAEENL